MDIHSYSLPWILQKTISEYLNEDEGIVETGLSFICEDSKDVGYRIKEALAKQGLACIVMTPNSEYIGHNGKNQVWDFRDVTLEFLENVPINRSSNKERFVSGLDLANYCSSILSGPRMNVFGSYCPKEIRQDEEGNLLVTTFTFDCSACLDKYTTDVEWEKYWYEYKSERLNPVEREDGKIVYEIDEDTYPKLVKDEEEQGMYLWDVQIDSTTSTVTLKNEEYPEEISIQAMTGNYTFYRRKVSDGGDGVNVNE